MMFSNIKANLLPDLYIDNSVINRTTQLIFLGIIYDEGLSFKYHINHLTLKITALLYQLKEMPTEILIKLYYAHIYPYLLYSNPIWSNAYVTHLKGLNTQLKKGIRTITKSRYLEHKSSLQKYQNYETKRSVNVLFSNMYV